MATLKPIRFEFPDATLERLARRLDDAHLPDTPIVPDAGWKYGTELGKLKQILADWKSGAPARSDGSHAEGGGVQKWWKGVEKRINRHPHFLVEIEGISVHYQIAKSKDPDAVPLIFSHGWPGSFFEADLILDRLSAQSDKGTSFHVVVPSLPGYGLSGPPPRQGWTLQDTARVFDTLMTEVLGYKSYAAQGGDWGYAVTRFLANHPGCKAYHTNFIVPNPPMYASAIIAAEKVGAKGLAARTMPWLFSDFETGLVKRGLDYLDQGFGYYSIQSTKPASLGYGMHDSPVAVLSWFLDKFQGWSDPGAPAFAPKSKADSSSGINDENLLINVTLYWLSGTIHTSFLPYKEMGGLMYQLGTDRKLTAPARDKPYGHSGFPYELAGSPKAWIPRCGLNLVFYRTHEKGGHFAALDNPEALADDVRDFFTESFPRA
ncbi:alpha/beta-hydrolase [Tilletiopsis washingtonensis]|uniref:Alpha/beta-hydrolase n=1 Tax=Tilletiopsis washingtonensis TaxID=58919 RepID=A0A316Z7G7_9BASI|nr:alpha/beta-hydrolase [Tilletiopsis washingtonensis]PWN96918.1 alpha/beta-hydrolase [Tilletiopsis washingtonensis]